MNRVTAREAGRHYSALPKVQKLTSSSSKLTLKMRVYLAEKEQWQERENAQFNYDEWKQEHNIK